MAFAVGCSKNICIAICMVNDISSRSSRYSDILAESVRVYWTKGDGIPKRFFYPHGLVEFVSVWTTTEETASFRAKHKRVIWHPVDAHFLVTPVFFISVINVCSKQCNKPQLLSNGTFPFSHKTLLVRVICWRKLLNLCTDFFSSNVDHWNFRHSWMLFTFKRSTVMLPIIRRTHC